MTAQLPSQIIPAWDDGQLQPLDKMEVHLRGLRHPAISVFVQRGEETLLQQRAFGKYHTPGLWTNTCCTHPHWQESALDCANRRLSEELGIAHLALRPVGEVEYRAEVGNGLIEHEVVSIFLADAPEDFTFSPNPEEVAATRWISFDALDAEIEARPGEFTPWLKIYLSQHRQRIFGL